ncbi:MAG TPA: 16S rRNA methyltransferase [Roseiflexaceae bacterium]|nr:16S rRNA methyltransferase [Roseiflexaceae bacterium]
MSDADIAELLNAVRSSSKYAPISEELVRSIGLRELAARRNLKQAIKATKNKLHQVAGAYVDGRLPYDEWLAMLEAAADEGRRTHDTRQSASELRTQNSELAQACLTIMRYHASTRERLPILRDFYATTLASLGPLRSVLDLACGLNPLALPWMPLAPDASYYACDIYADMIAFLDQFFALAGVRGQARVCDLVAAAPAEPADLALVLKALPPLEQQARNAGRDLLRALNARHILVSFPARSLGGRGKGMAENYELRFQALAEAEGWPVERFVFPTELAFLVRKA